MYESPFVRQKILSALTSLVNKHGFNSITVKQIADMAEISRQTFYLHFADKYSAAAAVFAQDLIKAIEAYSTGGDGKAADNIEILLAIMEKRQDFYVSVLTNRGQNPLFEFMVDALCIFTETVSRGVRPLDEKAKAHIRLYHYGFCTYITYWISHTGDISKWELADYLADFIPDSIRVRKNDIGKDKMWEIRDAYVRLINPRH
jgi:AcrR family transcriptional regulator